MKSIKLKFFVVVFLTICTTNGLHAIVQEGSIFSSIDEKIYVSDKNSLTQKVGVGFELGYLKGRPILGSVLLHYSSKELAPTWLLKLSGTDKEVFLLFFFEGLEDPVVCHGFVGEKNSDFGDLVSLQYRLVQESLLEYFTQRKMDFILIVGPNASKGSFEEKYTLNFYGKTNPKSIFNKINSKANENKKK